MDLCGGLGRTAAFRALALMRRDRTRLPAPFPRVQEALMRPLRQQRRLERRAPSRVPVPQASLLPRDASGEGWLARAIACGFDALAPKFGAQQQLHIAAL